jgi:hypothetical protein
MSWEFNTEIDQFQEDEPNAVREVTDEIEEFHDDSQTDWDLFPLILSLNPNKRTLRPDPHAQMGRSGTGPNVRRN